MTAASILEVLWAQGLTVSLVDNDRLEEFCTNFFTQYDHQKKKDACNRYNFEKSEMPKELAFHAAKSLGKIALLALGAILLWMLMAWIGRGFLVKKD